MTLDGLVQEVAALVDLACYLTITANSEETQRTAARKRHEAYLAIAEVEEHLARLKATLGLFPRPILELECR